MKAAIWVNPSGSIAISKGTPSSDPTQPPVLLQRLRLTRTGEPTNPTSKADASRSVEIFRDPNTGALIYLSETGHFTTVKN